MFWQLIVLISSTQALQQTLKEPSCTSEDKRRTIMLTVSSKRNATGGWVDSVSGWTEMSNSSQEHETDIKTDFAHTITECEGKRIVHFQTVSRVSRYPMDKLKFHPRCGINIAVLNKGLSVQKISSDDLYNSAVFTNRPLRDEEIFEIVIEGKKLNSDRDLGIGFMTKPPADVEILAEMWKSPFAWMYHDLNLYHNASKVRKSIGKNTNTFQVGDRVGVMRSELGTLHTFYNGQDQGPAMSNVPPNVYGVLDLRASFEKASIV